jgi:hypothetical protein
MSAASAADMAKVSDHRATTTSATARDSHRPRRLPRLLPPDPRPDLDRMATSLAQENGTEC